MNPAVVLWLAAAVAGMERDPKLAALMREDRGSEAAVVATLGNHNLPAERRARLLSGLCEVRGMRGLYADAATACEAEAKIDRGSKDSAVFWRSIAAVPPPVASGFAELPIRIGDLGLTEVAGTVSGTPIVWGIDTGAEVSIMPASMAQRLGLRHVGGGIHMDTSTVPVSGTLAVIDELKLGAAAVRNVVVLVLPDARFNVGEGMKLPPLLGLPMLQAFGRIAWLDGAKRLALGRAVPSVPAGAGAQLYWHQDGIGLRFDAARGRFVAHFDTGANRLSLYPDALPLLSGAELSSIRKRETLTGGAGGALKRKQDHVARLSATVAGVPANFADVPVERDLHNSGARLGMDYVKQLSSLTLDFTSMRVLAVPKPTDTAAVDLGFLSGEWVLRDGRAAQFPLTMTRGGELQASLDGGVKWQTIFDYRYQRAAH